MERGAGYEAEVFKTRAAAPPHAEVFIQHVQLMRDPRLRPQPFSKMYWSFWWFNYSCDSWLMFVILESDGDLFPLRCILF